VARGVKVVFFSNLRGGREGGGGRREEWQRD